MQYTFTWIEHFIFGIYRSQTLALCMPVLAWELAWENVCNWKLLTEQFFQSITLMLFLRLRVYYHIMQQCIFSTFHHAFSYLHFTLQFARIFLC